MLAASMLRPALSPMPLHARAAVMTSLAAGAVESSWRDDIPNALTASRIVAVPLLACAFYWQRTRAARVPAAIFLACAITDWLDGFLARRWSVDSDLGAFLDPVADKLLVCTCLALLSGELGPIVALPTAMVVCREVAVSALREWMGSRGERAAVAVGWWGKVKTATQMIALQLLLFAAPAVATSTSALVLLDCGLALLYVATLLTWTSAWGYFAAAAPLLMKASSSASPASEDDK